MCPFDALAIFATAATLYGVPHRCRTERGVPSDAIIIVDLPACVSPSRPCHCPSLGIIVTVGAAL